MLGSLKAHFKFRTFGYQRLIYSRRKVVMKKMWVKMPGLSIWS